jgi:AmmeMemoRadiSam system protein B
LEEHSLEVQVPFIQAINPEARILPITISSQDPDALMTGGREIADTLLSGPGTVLLVASTDMSHYVDADSAAEKDRLAIDRILALDAAGLFETVMHHRISMCGVAPTVMLLSAAIEAGATVSETVEYTHSGKVSGDDREVVAYLSMLVY